MRVTIHHAKTHLSKLIAAAERGEDVVIARGSTPVVRLTALSQTPMGRRVAGSMKGRISIGPEFFEPLPDDELAAWNGE